MNDGRPPFDDDDQSHPAFSTIDGDRVDDDADELDGANDEALAIKLATLEEEHRDLDAAITAMEMNTPYERLTIARLKKKKLHLKDKIQKIKDAMLPDIIA